MKEDYFLCPCLKQFSTKQRKWVHTRQFISSAGQLMRSRISYSQLYLGKVSPRGSLPVNITIQGRPSKSWYVRGIHSSGSFPLQICRRDPYEIVPTLELIQVYTFMKVSKHRFQFPNDFH
jgi:hypothetical protein